MSIKDNDNDNDYIHLETGVTVTLQFDKKMPWYYKKYSQMGFKSQVPILI